MKPLPIQRNNSRHDGFDQVCDAWAGMLDEEAIKDLARVTVGLPPTDPTVVFLKSAGYFRSAIISVPGQIKALLQEWKNTVQMNDSSVLRDRIVELRQENERLRRSTFYSKSILVSLLIGLVVGGFFYARQKFSDVAIPTPTPQEQLQRGLAAVGIQSTVTDSETNVVITIHTEGSTDYRWDTYRRFPGQKDLRLTFYKLTLLPEGNTQ